MIQVEQFEQVLRGSLRLPEDQLAVVMSTVMSVAYKTLIPHLGALQQQEELPPERAPVLRKTNVPPKLPGKTVSLGCATPPFLPRLQQYHAPQSQRLDVSQCVDGEVSVENIPRAEPVSSYVQRWTNGLQRQYVPAADTTEHTSWTDADLYRLNRDTSWWTVDGADFYDIRPHVPVLYAIARWINWPDPRDLAPIRPPRILEIGVREGVSTMALLHACRETDGRLISLDCDAESAALALRHVRDARLTKWWDLRIVHSDEFSKGFEGPIDMLWVDGEHSEEQVRKDLDHYLPHVRLGGVVVLHDYYETIAPDESHTSGVRKVMQSHTEWQRDVQWTVLPWAHGLVVGVVRAHA